MLGGLAVGPSRVRGALRSEDTEATVEGMDAFGTHLAWDGEDLRIIPAPLQIPRKALDVRNSGTSLRFLAGVAALVPGVTTLTGDASIQKRPMAPLLDALSALGAEAKSIGGDGRPPVEIRGTLRGGSTSLPGDVSSQFLSSLLIACPRASDSSEIRVLPPVRSEPYVEMTRALIRRFGGQVEAHRDTYRIPGEQTYRGAEFDVPGDFSSAAFPLVGGAITDGDVTVTNLAFGGLQGDEKIVEFLRAFGADVAVSANRVRVRGGRLRAQRVDVSGTPDLFPILAVLASQAEGETHFVNGAHLRFKESDRIASTVSMLQALGIRTQTTDDGCIVSGPNRVAGGSVDAHGDHRILMAAAVAGLVSKRSVDITDPWCFRASYPSFFDDIRALGAMHAVVV